MIVCVLDGGVDWRLLTELSVKVRSVLTAEARRDEPHDNRRNYSLNRCRVNVPALGRSIPFSWPAAYPHTLLKKPSLDKNDLKNYRPVSNLSFISKVVEKVVASRLLTHVELNDLSNPNQSAYKKNHSTETTLLKITNDISTNMEKKRVTVLTLLDLSAAFNTIDHAALLKLLSSWFGISGIALDWIQSYDRGQTVKIGENLSDSYTIKFGVPQGSVLGPILLTLYTTPLSSIIKKTFISEPPTVR